MNSACVGGTAERECGRHDARGLVGNVVTMGKELTRAVKGDIWCYLTGISCQGSEVACGRQVAVITLGEVRWKWYSLGWGPTGVIRASVRCVGERAGECVGHIGT